MPNYIKILDVDLTAISQEVNATFMDLTGGLSYEDLIISKNVPHTVYKLLPILETFGTNTQQFISRFNAVYGDLKSVSLSIFRRGGQIDQCVNGIPMEMTVPNTASVLVPIAGGPVYWSWHKYTGELVQETLDPAASLNRYLPAQPQLSNHEETIQLTDAIACNVGKLHSVVNLRPQIAVYLTCIFDNQDKLLSDINNNSLFG